MGNTRRDLGFCMAERECTADTPVKQVGMVIEYNLHVPYLLVKCLRAWVGAWVLDGSCRSGQLPLLALVSCRVSVVSGVV